MGQRFPETIRDFWSQVCWPPHTTMNTSTIKELNIKFIIYHLAKSVKIKSSRGSLERLGAFATQLPAPCIPPLQVVKSCSRSVDAGALSEVVLLCAENWSKAKSSSNQVALSTQGLAFVATASWCDGSCSSGAEVWFR